MQFITVIFLALAFTCSIGDKLDDANNYLDEVLGDHLEAAIGSEGLKVYELPDFSINHQEKTSDGHVLSTKINYLSGNLTGLDNVLRDRCLEPTESSGDINVVCHIVLPHLQAEYAGRFQSIKGFQNPFGVHIRQYDFTLEIDIREVKVEIEVISAPYTMTPSLKRLALTSGGKRSVRFHTEAANPEDVTKGVEERFDEPFNRLFLEGEFKEALRKAVGSVPYPRSE